MNHCCVSLAPSGARSSCCSSAKPGEHLRAHGDQAEHHTAAASWTQLTQGGGHTLAGRGRTAAGQPGIQGGLQPPRRAAEMQRGAGSWQHCNPSLAAGRNAVPCWKEAAVQPLMSAPRHSRHEQRWNLHPFPDCDGGMLHLQDVGPQQGLTV